VRGIGHGCFIGTTFVASTKMFRHRRIQCVGVAGIKVKNHATINPLVDQIAGWGLDFSQTGYHGRFGQPTMPLDFR